MDNIRMIRWFPWISSIKGAEGQDLAYKKIVDDESLRLRCQAKDHMKRAKIVVDYMIDGDESAAVDAMKKSNIGFLLAATTIRNDWEGGTDIYKKQYT